MPSDQSSDQQPNIELRNPALKKSAHYVSEQNTLQRHTCDEVYVKDE